MKWLFQNTILILIFTVILGQDFYIPTTSDYCPKNMLYYKEKEDNIGTCVCRNTTVYYPETNSCYDLYQKGPCLSKYYIVLSPEKGLAKCEKNPCLEDGIVPFKGGCHLLNEPGPPCKDNLHYLIVDKENNKISCKSESDEIFHATGVINAPLKACPQNTRRTALGCKKALE